MDECPGPHQSTVHGFCGDADSFLQVRYPMLSVFTPDGMRHRTWRMLHRPGGCSREMAFGIQASKRCTEMIPGVMQVVMTHWIFTLSKQILRVQTWQESHSCWKVVTTALQGQATQAGVGQQISRLFKGKPQGPSDHWDKAAVSHGP